MAEKRFKLNKDSEWWTVKDNTIKVNEFGYREDLTGEDAYRGFRQELTEQETVDLLNKLHEENQRLKKENDILIKQRFGEERLKQEIADYHTSNGKLHRLNSELIRRLDEFNINYLDILRNSDD